jgi:hypothetical protein
MNVTRCLWAIVGLCLACESVGLAQEPPPTVPPSPLEMPPLKPSPPPMPGELRQQMSEERRSAATVPATPANVGGQTAQILATSPYLRRPGPITLALDEQGFPLATGQPWTFFSPFEAYVRVGSAVVIGDKAMDNVIDAGVALEGGIRSYGYNPGRTAAWTCEIGLDYLFNNGTSSDVVLIKGGLTSVNRFGQTLNLPSIHRYALEQLHRTAVRATVGREWYFGTEDPEGIQYNAGVDFGGRLGWATAKLRAVSRDILGFQQGLDQLPEFLDGHTGDNLKGLLFGVNAGILVPHNGFEWTIGVRAEYGRDWFHILEDDSVESIRYMMFFGVRF